MVGSNSLSAGCSHSLVSRVTRLVKHGVCMIEENLCGEKEEREPLCPCWGQIGLAQVRIKGHIGQLESEA